MPKKKLSDEPLKVLEAMKKQFLYLVSRSAEDFVYFGHVNKNQKKHEQALADYNYYNQCIDNINSAIVKNLRRMPNDARRKQKFAYRCTKKNCPI